jgi:hypothetical protein
MTARRVRLVLGACWDFARFFLVLSLLATVIRAGGGSGAAVVPWLLLGATGNLLVPAGVLVYVLFPDRYAGLLGLLRLGKALSVFSFVLLAASGRRLAAGSSLVVPVGGQSIPAWAAAAGCALLDAVFLVLLLVERRGAGPASPRAAEGLPGAVMKDHT